MGVAVFPLTSTGFNGAKDIKRNSSHMEISKEGKRKEGSYLLFSFIFIQFFKSLKYPRGEQTRVVCKGVEHICCEIGWNVY